MAGSFQHWDEPCLFIIGRGINVTSLKRDVGVSVPS
jgi:hypothetical protein